MSPDALLHDARNAAVMHGRWPDSVHDYDGADLGILRMSGGMICWPESSGHARCLVVLRMREEQAASYVYAPQAN